MLPEEPIRMNFSLVNVDPVKELSLGIPKEAYHVSSPSSQI